MPFPRGTRFVLVALASMLGVATPAAMLSQASPPSVRASVRRVRVLDARNAVEIEVEGSERLLPQTRVLTSPDRLVVDFPDAVPGDAVRSQVVNRGDVKSVRIGLFQSSPPVTRVVLDLKTPQSFQVFPYGRTVIIKVTGGSPPAVVNADQFPPLNHPGLVDATYYAGAMSVQGQSLNELSANPPLDVSFRNGLLSIHASKANLSEILFAVHQRTGAEVVVAAGAETEQVVADYGPGPAPEVLAQLLNGSRFNFLIASSPDNPQMLERVLLSPRGNGVVTPMPQVQTAEAPDPEPPLAVNPPNQPPAPNETQPAPPNPSESRPDANSSPN